MAGLAHELLSAASLAGRICVAHEMGVAPVQDYLKQSQAPHSKTKVA